VDDFRNDINELEYRTKIYDLDYVKYCKAMDCGYVSHIRSDGSVQNRLGSKRGWEETALFCVTNSIEYRMMLIKLKHCDK